MKGPGTPDDDRFDADREPPTRRERSARHKKKHPSRDFDRPRRGAGKPRPWTEPDWDEDDWDEDSDDEQTEAPDDRDDETADDPDEDDS